MPRLQPPEGYLNLKDAVAFLEKQEFKISESMIYKFVKQGKLNKYGPPSRKQKYYSIKELEALVKSEKGRIKEETDVQFSPATLEDLDKITQLCRKLFKTKTLRPIETETRRSWFEKEQRGHYVVKRSNGDVVAYIHIVAMDDDHIEAYMRNEFRGRNITGEHVQRLEVGKPTGCIVVSIGSDPGIKKSLRQRHTSMLLRGVSEELKHLGEQGILIPRLYAYTESNDGILMSVKMRMKEYADPVGRRYTFWLDVLHTDAYLVRNYQRAVGRTFINHPEYAIALSEWQQRYHPGDNPE